MRNPITEIKKSITEIKNVEMKKMVKVMEDKKKKI